MNVGTLEFAYDKLVDVIIVDNFKNGIKSDQEEIGIINDMKDALEKIYNRYDSLEKSNYTSKYIKIPIDINMLNYSTSRSK